MKIIFKIFISILLLSVFSIAGCYQDVPVKNGIQELSSEVAHALIEKNAANPDCMIIDVRSENEFVREHIPGAVNLLYTDKDFTDKMLKYGNDKIYIFYCLSGGRSRSAIRKLIPLGFTHVYNMKGGIEDWKDTGYEVVSE